MKMRHRTAFTLVELLVAAGVSSILGLIMYGVASEAVVAFARNVSINRSYSNARQAVDRIGVAMQSAGHVPLLLDATGADNASSPAAGIRFWRCSSTPLYTITVTPLLTSSSLTLSLIKPGTTATVLPPPVVGDLITIGVLSFQAPVTAVTVVGTVATVSFSGTVATNTNPVLTASALLTAVTNTTTSTASGKMTCLDWNGVAFIAVNNELRYFRKFVSGSTNVTTAANYEVLTSLTAALGTNPTPLPFSLGPKPSINVDLYAEAPDYNNRTSAAGTKNGFNGLGTANTYTYLQTALSPRPGSILHSPY